MAIANPEVEFHMNGFLDQCVEILNNLAIQLHFYVILKVITRF